MGCAISAYSHTPSNQHQTMYTISVEQYSEIYINLELHILITPSFLIHTECDTNPVH